MNDNHFITNGEKNILLDKIVHTNFHSLVIDLSMNYNWINVEEDLWRKLIIEIKKIKPINILINLPIYDQSWNLLCNHWLIKNNDGLIINLKIPSYLIQKKEKLKIITQLYYINENKLIISDNFLDLDDDILNKYCHGVLLNNHKKIQTSLKFILVNGLNFIYNNKPNKYFWDHIMLQEYNSLIHCPDILTWQLLEIFHSTIILNDNQLKLSIINYIQTLEDQLIHDQPLDKQKILEFIDDILQKTNDQLYDING